MKDKYNVICIVESMDEFSEWKNKNLKSVVIRLKGLEDMPLTFKDFIEGFPDVDRIIRLRQMSLVALKTDFKTKPVKF